ncbi:MAG: type II toxin-antitoxin system RelE/ParE family toxin [Nitrospirota bacterium]|nr:type II toxin-antitoxin system RelE/ParE family toxin [Nitrospirota bacterium]
MSFSPIASPAFLKKKKKQFSDFQHELDIHVKRLLENPLLGEPKKGALQGVRILKFRYKKQLFLLSYEPDFKKKLLYLYIFGSHERFYEKLERYLRAK